MIDLFIVWLLLPGWNQEVHSTKQNIDTIYLIHLYDYHYLNSPWEQNGTHEIKFKNSVMYVLNSKDTIAIMPKVQSRYRTNAAEMKVIPVKVEKQRPTSVRFIANEKGIAFDTTILLPNNSTINRYLFFNIHDKEFLFIPKRNRIRANINFSPISNKRLHNKIIESIEKSGIRDLF